MDTGSNSIKACILNERMMRILMHIKTNPKDKSKLLLRMKISSGTITKKELWSNTNKKKKGSFAICKFGCDFRLARFLFASFNSKRRNTIVIIHTEKKRIWLSFISSINLHELCNRLLLQSISIGLYRILSSLKWLDLKLSCFHLLCIQSEHRIAKIIIHE